MAVLGARFAHLVQELLLVLEVDLLVLKDLRLVCAASASYGRHRLWVLRILRPLAARAAATKVGLPASSLQVPNLRRTARAATRSLIPRPALIRRIHRLDVAGPKEPIVVRPGLLGVLLVARVRASASWITARALIIRPALRVVLATWGCCVGAGGKLVSPSVHVQQDAVGDGQGIAGIVLLHLRGAVAEVKLAAVALPDVVHGAAELDDVGVATGQVRVGRELLGWNVW